MPIDMTEVEAEIPTIDMAASAPAAYKPSEDERDNYFHGFSGSPKLVARTGHRPWEKSMFESDSWTPEVKQHRKCYMAIVDSVMAEKWTMDISKRIIAALGRCKWSYFFPIRTCLRGDSPRGLRGTEATVMLVAVEPASLEWEDAIKIALSCRAILRHFGILDIEVEILEGGYTRHAASAELEALIDNKDQPAIKEKIRPLLSYPGYPVAYLENRSGQGTVGLHVKLVARGEEDADDTVYGLTCRHVVCGNRAAQESYKPSSKDQLSTGHQYYIQANANTFNSIWSSLQDIMETREAQVAYLQRIITEWDELLQYDNPKNISPPSDQNRHQLAAKQQTLAYSKVLLEQLAQIEDKKQRQIGQLAFLPTFTQSSQHRGYLRDWALIKLDSKKFPRAPDNTVYLGPLSTFRDRTDELALMLRDKTMDVFESLVVAKRGARTGLTEGTKSRIEAVVRHPGDGLDEDVYTWEYLIVPKPGTDHFSAPGDSGSAIFDFAGRVVGIVTASSAIPADEAVELPKGTHITFAAPIEWVMDDIQDFTGKQVRLA
ncbi:hypothetical protein GGS20DRAFT_591815 [Poronia punctata]|nr:hypothetical protein GGS20DRAFT_591815 [Poronia punctata]